jgi:hypothetical protein
MVQFASSVDDVERIGEEIATLAAQIHAGTYRLLTLLAEFDERGGWGGGFRSCAHWLSWRTGIAPGAAREKVRAARALRALPLVSAAMQSGELSFAKVRAITRVATVENEADLLEVARNGTAAQVERIVRAWRRVDRLEEAYVAADRHESRHLSLHVDDDGMYVVRGRLDPEAGALLEKALDRAGAALPNDIPAAQRRADAIAVVAERSLARADDDALRRPSFEVIVHVDADTLRQDATAGQAVVAGGARVSAETSRRIACDAAIRVMAHDTTGRALDIGRRARTVPAPIRRALEHRDAMCRFPGCELRRCDAHHIVHWADGGATALDNLVLLCRRHHRAVHEEGFHIERSSAGDVIVRRPDGRVLPPVPPAAPAGVEIAVAGSVYPPFSTGRPLDTGLAVLMLRGARMRVDNEPRNRHLSRPLSEPFSALKAPRSVVDTPVRAG